MNLFRQMRHAAVIAAAALTLGATVAGADTADCQGAIVKGAQKYASTRMKALQKCNESVLTGKITGPCPDAKAADKISKAATKLQDGITKSCTGVTVADLNFASQVNRCAGGAYDGNYCVTDGQCPGTCAGGTKNGEICTATNQCGGGTCTNIGTCSTATLCPAFLNDSLGGSCNFALNTAADVGTCITCASAAKIDSLIGTYYGTLLPLSADKDTVKCQKDIGKRTAKFYDAVEKALAKCQAAVIKAGSGSCPDTKTTDSINKAASKLDAAIAKSCSDAAKISGGTHPAAIAGQSSRFGACAPTFPQTSSGLSESLACLTQNAAVCDVGLSAGLQAQFDACSTLTCGNGQIDAGETCDDGNTVADSGSGADDICPPDCSVATCTGGAPLSTTVRIATTTNLVNALVLIGYNDAKVSIPGVGDQSSVLNSVSSGVFATSPRDTDTALRINLEDPTLAGVGTGAVATVVYNTCGSPVTGADFTCTVVSAGDASFQEVFGATCAVTVP